MKKTRKGITGQGQGTLGSFLMNRKRSAPTRQRSPTNQTSSPDSKKTQSEEINHEPDAILISSQRDKRPSVMLGEMEEQALQDPNEAVEREEEQNALQNPRSEDADTSSAAENLQELDPPPSILKTSYASGFRHAKWKDSTSRTHGSHGYHYGRRSTRL